MHASKKAEATASRVIGGMTSALGQLDEMRNQPDVWSSPLADEGNDDVPPITRQSRFFSFLPSCAFLHNKQMLGRCLRTAVHKDVQTWTLFPSAFIVLLKIYI